MYLTYYQIAVINISFIFLLKLNKNLVVTNKAKEYKLYEEIEKELNKRNHNLSLMKKSQEKNKDNNIFGINIINSNSPVVKNPERQSIENSLNLNNVNRNSNNSNNELNNVKSN